MDGSTVGWCARSGCSLCRPYRNADQEIAGYRHHLVLATVVGTGLSLPFDVEPYGPGDSEYAAGQRLLRRAIELLGVRFAAYVVVDGEYATAPFLHAAGKLGLPVVARLKPNLPELLAAAQKRFRSQPSKLTFLHGSDRVELWDAEDFDPWENLEWETVRVLCYRQQKPDGEVLEAFWLSNLSMQEVSSRVLFHRAKSRWEIENQGFNDAKNRHDLEHICHHHPNSLLITYSPEELKSAAFESDLDGPLVDYAAKGNKVELEGVEKVENHDAYKLKLTIIGGQVQHIWVDGETFLEVKLEGTPRRMDGKMRPVWIYLRDYKEVDGLMIPYVSETEVQGNRDTHKMIIENVVVNPKLEDSLFTKPSSRPQTRAQSK